MPTAAPWCARGRRNTSASTSSLAHMEIRPFIDRIRLTHRSTLATASWCETTRRDGDVRYARRTGYGQLGEIMYVPPRYRHTDKSVHTAPLYAIRRRWKINYSIFVRADDNNDRSPNYWKTNITGFLQYAIKIRPIIFIICNQKVTGDLIMSFHGDISNKPDKII